MGGPVGGEGGGNGVVTGRGWRGEVEGGAPATRGRASPNESGRGWAGREVASGAYGAGWCVWAEEGRPVVAAVDAGVAGVAEKACEAARAPLDLMLGMYVLDCPDSGCHRLKDQPASASFTPDKNIHYVKKLALKPSFH